MAFSEKEEGGGDIRVIQNDLNKEFGAITGTGSNIQEDTRSLTITPWINDDGPWKASDKGKTFGFQ